MNSTCVFSSPIIYLLRTISSYIYYIYLTFIFSFKSDLPTAMVAAGACYFPTVFSPLFHHVQPSKALKVKSGGIMSIVPRFSMSTEGVPVKEEKQRRSGWKVYFEQSKELIEADSGPPRWFSPLECSSQWDNSPLMLFLPGQSFFVTSG